MRKICSLLLVLFISFGFITNTYAHKVQMFAYPEGDNVFIEGYFADGKRPKKSEVVVYDSGGEVLFSGVTDEEGKLSFKIPRKTDLRITLNAGMGHKAEYTLPASELNGSNSPNPPISKVGDKMPAVDQGASSEKGRVSQISQLDEAQIQAIVEKAVEKAVGEAMKPLVRSFTEMTQKNSMTTIIGGIGYILGFMGIAFYFKSRKGS